MGSKSSKNGSILIRTDQLYYISGDMVTGNVYLNAPNQISSNRIILIIQGREQTWWKVQQNDKKNSKNKGVQSYKHFQGENVLYSNFINLYQPMNFRIQKGQYIFPFAFRLGAYLPGTFYQEKNNYKGRINYTLRTECQSSNKDFQLKHEQELVIRQPQKEYQRPLYGQITMEPVVCCCIKKGRTKIKCYFDKNAYLPGEEAVIICEIDNLNCDLNIKRINCTLYKNVELYSNQGYEKKLIQVISQIKFPGLDAGKAYLGESAKRMTLTLSNKKDTQIQPSTEGRLIKCQYYLQIKASISGCICCNQIPSVIAPIKILSPPAHLAKIQQPQNWDPKTFPKKELLISDRNTFDKNIGLNPYIRAMNETQVNDSIMTSEKIK